MGVQLGPLLVKEVNKDFLRVVGGLFGQAEILRKQSLINGKTVMFPLTDLEIPVLEFE